MAAAVLLALAIYLYIDTAGSRERLKSLYGITILFGIGFVFSKHMRQVRILTQNNNRKIS